jgi:16S rRNA processing protein RimM
LIGQLSERRVIVGRVSGLYGVKGWIKIYSFTRPSDRIFRYRPWYLHSTDKGGIQARQYEIAEDRHHGKGLIALLGGVDDRDSAEKLVGAEIFVDRDQFGGTQKDEYYWADLLGTRVVTTDDQDLGVVESLLETGANDVLVVQGDRRRLVPFLLGSVIQTVDLDSGIIVADWDPDF